MIVNIKIVVNCAVKFLTSMRFRFRFQGYILLLFLAFSSVQMFSQCLDIETILVDSCDSTGDEGFNEMTRFRTGAAPLNVGIMNVNWPAQSWQGLAQNALTASKVSTLNAQIASSGGCGRLVEPIAGVIPANTEVILITSQNFSLTANSFGALIQDIYILFQDNTTVTTGHFGNYNATSGIRTLTISFGACSDTVSYDRSLLVDANGVPGSSNGATVNFTAAGVASYGNAGCVAPIDVFSVDAGNTVSACPGATITLAGTAQGQASILWTAPSGTFLNDGSLNSTYTLPFTASGSIVLTLTVTNSCGNTINDTVTIGVNSSTTPNFPPTLSFCSGSTAPTLNTISPNGISGVWSPAVIDNMNNGNYLFTPTAGQCAGNFTLTVTVTAATIIPDFSSTVTLCSGTAAPALNATSPNGITGVWSPSVIDNMTNGTYLFTPNAGQCASNFPLTVNITSANIAPDFAPTLTLCSGNTAPVLNSISPNGITGVWSPAVISNTSSAPYLFTPNVGQCASNFTLIVTVTNANIVPTFPSALSVCSGTAAPTLNVTSPNGITGSWSPSVIDNANNGSYIFTPASGQCATIFTLTVSITAPNIIPTFNAVNPICGGDLLTPLPTISTNGITGAWSPVLDNTQTTTYNFTPSIGQCALNTQLIISVNPPTTTATFAASTLTICAGDALVPLPTTSLNGISGNWSPALNSTQNQVYTFTPNAGQCSLGTTFSIAVTPRTIPTFNAINSVCIGGNLNLLPTTSLNGITGTWSPALDNSQTTTYTFQPDANQCATTANLTIAITPATLPAFIPIAPVCAGTSVNPLPSVSANGITGMWSPAFDNMASQLYTFTPNPGQCATTATLNITVAANPIIAKTAYICFDATGQLVNPAFIESGLPAADYSFVWTQDGNPLTNSTASIQVSQIGIYEVTAINTTTNCTITITTNVQASPVATAIAYVNEDFSDTQQIIVEVTGALDDFLYQLDYGPFQQSNTFAITKGGDYTIRVKDVSGCNNFELSVTALHYPKFFTPNNDGYNDAWNVDGLERAQDGQITIFDRYGKLLKQISATGEGWNGSFNGTSLPGTDYWFVISYKSLSGVSKTFRSHFSLKR